MRLILVFSPSIFLRNLNIKNLETTILVTKLLISTYRPKISSSQTVSLTFTMIPSQGFFLQITKQHILNPKLRKQEKRK